VLAALVALGALALPAAASGGFTTYWWEFSSCPQAVSVRDAPVNVVFYGNATGPTSNSFFLAHFAWPNTDATDRYFQSSANCGSRDWKQASAPVTIPVGAYRYMIQARHTSASDAVFGSTVTAAARRQKKVSATCFAVAPGGYDYARKYIYKVLSGVPGIGAKSTYQGNTATLHQCDGSFTGGNGWVYWFKVP
jgi:hypothetical protein